MGENHWETDTNEVSFYEDVKADFNEMISESEAIENYLFFNGRDFDTKHFDNLI